MLSDRMGPFQDSRGQGHGACMGPVMLRTRLSFWFSAEGNCGTIDSLKTSLYQEGKRGEGCELESEHREETV